MKKIFMLIVAFLAMSSFLACRIVQDVGVPEWDVISKDLEIDTENPVTIVFWHTMGKTTDPAKGGTALLEAFIAEFQAIYPHITVLHESKGGYTELRNAINTALPAGLEPNMSYSYADHVAGYINSGRVVPLNNLINSNNPEIAFTQEEIDDFVPGFWAEGKVFDTIGTMLNLPFIKSTEVMFYNETFFNQHQLSIPRTWDEVEAVSQAIRTIIDNDSSLSDAEKQAKIPFGYDSEANLFITASEQKGIPYTALNDDGTASVLFNNDQAKSMVEFFNGLFQRRLFTTKEMMGGAYTSDKFKVQNLYMSVSSTGGTKYNLPDPAGSFVAKPAMIPQFDINNPKVIQQGPNINLFMRDNIQEVIASWLFLKYITEPEQSARFSIPSGYSPVRISSAETDVFKAFVEKANPSAEDKLFIEVLQLAASLSNYFFTSPAFDRSSKARDEVGAIFVNVFGGTKSIQDAFNHAYSEVMF